MRLIEPPRRGGGALLKELQPRRPVDDAGDKPSRSRVDCGAAQVVPGAELRLVAKATPLALDDSSCSPLAAEPTLLFHSAVAVSHGFSRSCSNRGVSVRSRAPHPVLVNSWRGVREIPQAVGARCPGANRA